MKENEKCIENGEGVSLIAVEVDKTITLLPYVDLRRVDVETDSVLFDFGEIVVEVRGQSLHEIVPLIQRQQVAVIRSGGKTGLKIDSVRLLEKSE